VDDKAGKSKNPGDAVAKACWAESRKRRDVGAKNLDVDVGDKVWVLFPNVKVGTSQKLAFRLHGTYVLREWLHGEKRVALLAHEQDENDVVMAHVDRIVKKKEVPKKLRDLWKPIRMELVKDADEIKVGTKKEAGREKQGKLEVAPQGKKTCFMKTERFESKKSWTTVQTRTGWSSSRCALWDLGPRTTCGTMRRSW
jgi:hypothetical protein